jgi:beta-galactosidase
MDLNSLGQGGREQTYRWGIHARDRIFTPRQDTPNGRLGQGSILHQYSNRGWSWSLPVSSDSFERNKGEKRVLFSTPGRARFVRLTAFEGFAGQGFASHAEFGVIGSGE